MGYVETRGLGFRLMQWVFQVPTLPAPEYYSKDDPNPEHIDTFTIEGKEYKQGKLKPETRHNLRPPWFHEALSGISNT